MKQGCLINEPDTVLKYAFRRDIAILFHLLPPANGVRRCLYRTSALHTGGRLRPAQEQHHQASEKKRTVAQRLKYSPGTELENQRKTPPEKQG
jgi:hypothetical protein